MQRFFHLLFSLLLTLICTSGAFAGSPERQTVRIGAFNYYPGIFKAKDGSVQGFYVDFLAEIAQREGWQLEYSYGNWSDGLSRIKTGEVDLLTSVAWTQERAEYMDFGKVPILTVWGELYVPNNSLIESIRDVKGKKIGGLKGDFNAASFRNLVDRFGIRYDFVEYGNFEEVFKAVASGELDGGVVNNTFGAAKQHEYGLKSSGVIFNPFDIFFTVAKGKNSQIINTIDKHLSEWRVRNDSPFHKARQRWSHGDTASFHLAVPSWVSHALITLFAITAVAVTFVVLLRIQVRHKTAELTAHAADRKIIEDTLFFVNESGSHMRGDRLLETITSYVGNCLAVEYAFISKLLPESGRARTIGLFSQGSLIPDIEYNLQGTPCENVIGKDVCIYPDNIVQLFPHDKLLVEMKAEGYAGVPLWDSQGNSIGLMGVISQQPLRNNSLVKTVIQIAASRAAQELEAISYLEALKLKTLTIKQINDAVFWISTDGNVWEMNDAAARMLGYPEEYTSPLSILEIDRELAQTSWLSHWNKLKQKEKLKFETIYRTKDGQDISVEVSESYCSHNDKEYLCAIARDITERKRLEQQLEHRLSVLTEPMGNLSNLRIEDIFDLEELQKIQDSFAAATGVASVITDVAGLPVTRPSNFSDLCLNVIRTTEKGLAHCVNSDALLGSVESEGPNIQRCLSAGLWDSCSRIQVGSHHLGNWLIGQILDGSCDPESMMTYAKEIGADEDNYRQALAKVTRMPKEQFAVVSQSLYQIAGQLSRLAIQNVQQAQHIAERKRTEEHLIEYRKLFENTRDMICVIDSDYRYRIANNAYLRYRVRTQSNIVGIPAAEIIGEDKFAAIKHHVDECLRGKSVCYEMQDEHPDKGLRSLEVTYTPFVDNGGNPRLACIIRDQTEHKSLEGQLLQSQKMEAIGQLSGGIAHDFNNILTVIIGYSNMLLMDDKLTDTQKDKLVEIIEASERAAHLTRGLLAFSRNQTLSQQNLNLNDIVNHVLKFLIRIIGEDIKLQFIPHQSDLSVYVDRSQIEQLLMNLAANARDAMHAGGALTIETSRHEIDREFSHAHGLGEPGSYACMVVSDTGIGMDRETRGKIFEPFFTTKEVGKGTGLGMAIVYGIVKQHKGFINVYSEADKGTTFSIYFPLNNMEQESITEATAAEPPQKGTETILLAEDDEKVRIFVESILTEFGYAVIPAVDGHDCIEKFIRNQNRIDLILMDVIMPLKNGKEAFEEIKTIKPDVKVLYSSGYTADFIHNRGIIDDDLDIIMKPVQPSLLLQKIRHILNKC